MAHLMKILIYMIVVLLVSCNDSKNQEIRKPFEVNQKVTTDVLLDNGYERIWGVDVILYGKKVNKVNVYYQIDLPQLKGEVSNESEHEKVLRKRGKVDWKNFEEIFTENEYNYFRKSIQSDNYQIIETEREKDNYSKDQFMVVNLKSKDTFNCSLVIRDGELVFSSNTIIKN